MKKNNSKLRKALNLINDIERVRSKNNKNWMDILRHSIKLDFNKTVELIEEIHKEDVRISNLAKKISKLKI